MIRLDTARSLPRKRAQERAKLHTAVPLLSPVKTARILGYARVSRLDQNMEMQDAALKQAGVQDFFVEKISAVSAHRPQFNLMMKMLETGDTLVVYAFSRLHRNVKDLLTTVDTLRAMGVKLRSTSEPHVDPYSTNGRLLISVTGAVDENERLRICDRTRDGMAARKALGMFFGRQRVVTPAVAKKMQSMRDAGVKVTEIADKFEIKPSTVYANTKR
jgi:DNA invertase Pin-like site-specific DNA recombinase